VKLGWPGRHRVPLAGRARADIGELSPPAVFDARRVERQRRFARMLAGRDGATTAREALERQALEVVITGLESGYVEEEKLSFFADLILARADAAFTPEEFLALTRSLADRWPLFEGLWLLRAAQLEGRFAQLDEPLVAASAHLAAYLELAREGPLGGGAIGAAATFAEEHAELLERIAEPAVTAVFAGYRAAAQIMQAAQARWSGSADAWRDDLGWYAEHTEEVLQQGLVTVLLAVGTVDQASFSLVRAYPGMVDALDRQFLRWLVALSSVYGDEPSAERDAIFAPRLGTGVVQAEHAAGLELYRSAMRPEEGSEPAAGG
jgi:hypothetical protein